VFKPGDTVICINNHGTNLKLTTSSSVFSPYTVKMVFPETKLLAERVILEENHDCWTAARFVLVSFKPGDKVRCIDSTCSELEFNKVYIVTRTVCSTGRRYVQLLDDPASRNYSVLRFILEQSNKNYIAVGTATFHNEKIYIYADEHGNWIATTGPIP
jgi:hypothetical protein